MKSITLFYSYGMGGWGDFIKGLHTVWCWSKAMKRDVRIHFHNHVFGTLFPQHVHSDIQKIHRSFIDKVGKATVQDLLPLEQIDDIVVTCNWFSLTSVDNTYADFYKEFYTTLFPVRPYVHPLYHPSSYHVLHCRIGDKYLTEATSCKGDNRIGSIARLKTLIDEYNALGHEHTLVCSDSASIVKHLLTHVKGAFAICQQPYHIAYNSATIQDHKDDIYTMIQEHEAMTHALTITKVAYSGFPITAARIGSVPLYIYEDNVRKPYNDLL